MIALITGMFLYFVVNILFQEIKESESGFIMTVINLVFMFLGLQVMKFVIP